MIAESIVTFLNNIPLIFKYLAIFFIGASPIMECRGAILVAFGLGLNPWIMLPLAIIGNILVIPVIFYFLDVSGINKLAHKMFGKNAMKKIQKNKERFEIYEELALILFVAIPFPMTGAWMGTFVAHILQLNRRKSWIVISIGVLISSAIVFLSTYGISSLF